MGNCGASTNKVGYAELRESIPGSLVSEQDFDLFYSLCKIESPRAISTYLIPNHSPLFYVVVSGEIHVHLTSREVRNKSIVGTIFTSGETIHFFNAALRTTNFPSVSTFDFGEILRNNGVKLALHFKSFPSIPARVIGIDRNALEEFMVLAKHNTHALTSFLGLSMAEMVHRSPYLKTISQEQAAMFGVLMKVRLSHTGTVISPLESETISCHSDSSSIKSPSDRSPMNRKANKSFHARCCIPAGPVSLLFHGTALAVPYGTALHPMVQSLKHPHTGPSRSQTPKMFGARSGPSASKLLSPLNSLPSFSSPMFGGGNRGALHAPAVFSATHNRTENSIEREPDEDVRQFSTVHPGIMSGLGGLYCRNPQVHVRTIVTSSPCVIGYLSYDTMDALFSVDPRFNRVLQRNYFMRVMRWLMPTVPFLRDIDEWSFALLSCKVTLKCFAPETVIYQRGNPSDFAYIIVGGAIKELIESSALKISPMAATPRNGVQIERILNAGTLFGEVALASNNPYFSTVTTKEPTMVLCISKHVLEQIYNNNKTKLCEIRIRLLGGDAALQHVVDHPRGCQLFQTYLDKELAGENLRFYTAVDRFDSMCADVLKQYNHAMSVYTAYMHKLHPTSENGEMLGYPLNDGDTVDSNTVFPIQPFETEMIDLEQEDASGFSKKTSLTLTTPVGIFPNSISSHYDGTPVEGGTRHSSFVSETSYQSMQQYFTSEAKHALNTASSRSDSNFSIYNTKHNSMDLNDAGNVESDKTYQVTELAGSNTRSDTSVRFENSPYKSAINTRKPLLETIKSESNFTIQDDSAKFSIKYKPTQQISNKSGNSNQIIPLTEQEFENDEDGKESAFVMNAQAAMVNGQEGALLSNTVLQERVVDPEKAREVARTITQKLHRIQKNIVELKQVARSIMLTYIYNGSEMQLNLPDALRVRTENKFKVWSTSLLASVTRDSLANARADENFQSLKPSIDRICSFDFTSPPEEPFKNAGNGVTATHERTVLSQSASNRTNDSNGLQSLLSGSSEFTSRSNVNTNYDFTPSTINHSADEYGSSNAHNGAGGIGEGTIRKLGQTGSGFKASAPFITSFAPRGAEAAGSNTASLKPSPIKIPYYVDPTSGGGMDSQSNRHNSEALEAYAGQRHEWQSMFIDSANTKRGMYNSNSSRLPLPKDLNNSIAAQLQSLDLTFISLFAEAKQEVLKLLRDDKFPRFKLTHEFYHFISAIKPYEHDAAGDQHNYSYNNLDNSLSGLGMLNN